MLRALALGLFFYLYTRLGLWRGQPPAVACVQGAIFFGLLGWWAWKAARRQGLPRSPLALPLAAVAGAAALSALFSVDRRLSMPGMLEIVTPILFFFLFCDLLLAGWSPRTLVNAMLVLATVLIGQGLRVTANWHWECWQLRVPEYPTFLLPFRLPNVVADHPNTLASLLTLALPFVIVRLTESRRPWQRLAYGLWLAAADVLLFWTRSRGGWLGAGAAAAITVGWLALQRRPERLGDLAGWLRKTWRIWLAGAAYLALFGAFVVLDARASPSTFTTSGGSVRTLAGRPLFWNVAWQSFLAQPLTGSGLLSYTYTFVSSSNRVREWVSPHAHNLFLHVLGEQGVVGLAALGWVFAAGALALAGGWRSTRQGDAGEGDQRRSMLVSVAAGLVGCCLVHAQADIPFWLPANALLVVMLLAMGVQAAGALQPGREGLGRWRLWLLAVPLLLVYILGRQTAGYAALLRGADAALQGDWQAAAHALDEAVAADPSFSFYQAQRGYAYGVVADTSMGDGDPAALAPALASYRLALPALPEHVPNLLNTAWLLEQEGAAGEAEQMLAAAVEHGGDWALPALLLGDRYAAQGREAEAEALFGAAFAREAQAREMAACRRSAACRSAASSAPAAANAVAGAHERAQALLADGHPEEALAALEAVPVVSSDPLPWLDRADAHLALGQQAQARYALSIAQVLGAGDAAHRAHNALSIAAYHRAQGRADDAIAALERAARPQVERVSYDVAIYRRSPLPGLLLPGLTMLQRTEEDLAVYRELAHLYAEEGRQGDAAWAEAQAAALAALLGAEVRGAP